MGGETFVGGEIFDVSSFWASGFGLLDGSPTMVRKVYPPEKKKGGIIVDGEDVAAAVKQLVEFLTKKGAI